MYMLYMNSDEFAAALTRIDTVVLPIGMTEAHGHHCPLGTDVIIPRHFLQLIEEKMGDELIIAPEIPYGHSWHLAPYPGTIDIPPAVFTEYVLSVGRGFSHWGVKNLVLFNGHGGNTPALTHVMEELADLGMTVLLINWWQDYAKEILTICSGQGHAGEDETSTVLAIDEKLVDMTKANVNWQKAVANVRFPGMQQKTMAHAQTGDATLASKAKGEAIYALCIEKIIALLQALQRGELVVDVKQG